MLSKFRHHPPSHAASFTLTLSDTQCTGIHSYKQTNTHINLTSRTSRRSFKRSPAAWILAPFKQILQSSNERSRIRDTQILLNYWLVCLFVSLAAPFLYLFFFYFKKIFPRGQQNKETLLKHLLCYICIT